MEAAWEDALGAAELTVGGVRVVRRGTRQAAVFRLEDGTLRAVDNRCPHEGYPLAQGERCGKVLTCSWHNFKFDLDSGACLKGDESVAVLGVREVDGRVQLDWSRPDPDAALPRRWASLEDAVHEQRVGQAIRDAARLLDLGVPPERLVLALVARDAARGLWGPSHALAVGADLLRYRERYPGLRFTVPLAQLVDLVAESTVRRPVRAPAAPIDPGAEPRIAGEAFRAAVEGEQVAVAEGLIRGALARGWRRAELEPWLLSACAAHFLDFGHALIYQSKVLDLLDAGGWRWAPEILAGHVVGIVNGTREDATPGWGRFMRRLDGLLARWSGGWEADDRWEPAPLIRALHRPAVEALDALDEALAAGAPLERLLGVLVGEAAERPLRFDPAFDADLGVQDDWLSVSHVLTFTEAVRQVAARAEGADRVRLLAWSVRMIAQHRVLDGPRPVWTELEGGPEVLIAAIVARDAEAALGLAAGLLERDPEGMRAALADHVVADPAGRAVMVAHLLKTCLAGFDAWAATGDPRPVLAAVRMLATRIHERRVARMAGEAVALVGEGRTPRVLAP